MAKVTLVLEDKPGDDGTNGLTIKWDVEPKIETDSVAVAYAEAFVQHIVGNAKEAKFFESDDTAGPDTTLN